MTRRFWRREFFHPLDNKKGFSHPHLIVSQLPFEKEGRREDLRRLFQKTKLIRKAKICKLYASTASRTLCIF
jgi:hypothetical protein